MQRLNGTLRLGIAGLLILGLGVSSLAATNTSAKRRTASQKTVAETKTTTGKKAAASSHRGKSSKRSSSRRDRGQKAPTSERISEIQTALAKDGSFTGTPNGKWDNATVEAMKRFQASHGLSPSGKLEAKTLQKLGLGSRTAGLAPPTPAVRVSANTEPQSPIARRP
jgi:peptidoglycan hydrolase-like protein with peptidoglycan-binding domain